MAASNFFYIQMKKRYRNAIRILECQPDIVECQMSWCIGFCTSSCPSDFENDCFFVVVQTLIAIYCTHKLWKSFEILQQQRNEILKARSKESMEKKVIKIWVCSIFIHKNSIKCKRINTAQFTFSWFICPLETINSFFLLTTFDKFLH